MPSRLGRLRPTKSRRPTLVGLRAVPMPMTQSFAAQWLGYTPDLPDELAGLTGWDRGTKGLRIGAAPQGGGEAITTDVGFARVDSSPTSLPLNAGAAVTALEFFARTDELGRSGTEAVGDATYDLTLVALTAGTGGAASSKFYMFDPEAAAWVEIPYVANVGYPSAGAATATINGFSLDKSMPYTAVFPAGSVAHAPNVQAAGPAGTGLNLGLPVMVICNHLDPVYVFPADISSGGAAVHRHKYTEIHAGALEPFYSKCCYSWFGRMYYLCTKEAGTRRKQRLRWSALYEASPDPAVIGSGFFDVRDLSGVGLAIESMDPYLVLYFSDGIVFVERTELFAAPHRFRILSGGGRGILGAHCVAKLSAQENFIIATDGFYILNSNGEFDEIGLIRTGGTVYKKWFSDFYNNLDTNSTHLIQVHKDTVADKVRITWPNRFTGMQEVWTWDHVTDRMAVESWDSVSDTTVFGRTNLVVRAAIAWNAPEAPPTWTDPTAFGGTTWDSGAAVFGKDVTVHGDKEGLVYFHDSSLSTFDGAKQDWSLVSKRQTFGDPRLHTLISRVSAELLSLASTNSISVLVEAFSKNGVNQFTGGMLDNGASLFDPIVKSVYMRLSGTQVGLTLIGSQYGPVIIRKLILDLMTTDSELRL